MKQVIQFPFLFGLMLLITGAQWISVHHKSSAQDYCNTRFNFCVNYPESLLPVNSISDNDDGVILMTGDRFANVSVTGSYNILQWTPQALYKFTINDLPEKGENVKVISSLFGDDFYEAYFISGNTSYYHRAYFVNDYYILEIISVPVNKPELMARLKKEVNVQFEPQG